MARLQLVFLEDWHYTRGYGPRDPELFPEHQGLDDTLYPVQIVDSGPDTEYEAIMLSLFSAISAARSRVWITTAYFVPDESSAKCAESGGVARRRRKASPLRKKRFLAWSPRRLDPITKSSFGVGFASMSTAHACCTQKQWWWTTGFLPSERPTWTIGTSSTSKSSPFSMVQPSPRSWRRFLSAIWSKHARYSYPWVTVRPL